MGTSGVALAIGAGALAIASFVFPVNDAAAEARSVLVVIKNNSEHALINPHWVATHGKVSVAPRSGRIESGAVDELKAESDGVMTGTEGSVTYQIEGVGGQAQFRWDNPFVGNNSASGSAPAGFKVEEIGDKGNRTVVFFSFHRADRPVAMCNPNWVIDSLGHQPEPKLDSTDVLPGFVTTPLKRLGFGGWVDTGCRAKAEGWAERNAQWSTDKFWTIDVRLHSFVIADRELKPELSGKRYVRLEVEPGTPAHRAANVRTNQFIRVEGVVLIDTHHGEKLIEIHPFDPIVAVAAPGQGGQWIAVAGNGKTRWGWAYGKSSEAEAQSGALSGCGLPDCKIVHSKQNKCFAIVESKPTGFPWAVTTAAKIAEAQIDAQRACSEKAPQTCKEVKSACSE